MYRMISIEVSFHTCFKISFSSNIVDSQSFASEKGVILILSSLMSKSGLELVLADVMLDELLASGGAQEFLSIAKTESVTFVTTGDNKFVMS